MRIDVLGMDCFGKMIKTAKSSSWKKELVEGKQRIMYPLCDLYKLLHVSEPLFLPLKRGEIRSSRPGRVLLAQARYVCKYLAQGPEYC